VRLWNGAFLRTLLERAPNFSSNRRTLRDYQADIRNAVERSIAQGSKRSLFIVATGLGKTVIASSIAQQAYDNGLKKILVLCHATDLAYQLQREFWAQISKDVSTRVFLDGEPPVPIEGINFGLYQSFYNNLGGIAPDAFDLVIVDEAHHALANAFALSINHLAPKHLVGMTATPWRGDGESIETIFGEPIAKISLLDGMKWGFLSSVDYRLMCDNIDWEEVPKLSRSSLSIRDLNKRLFLPQRDEAVIDQLCEVANELDNPRIAIFSPSINHAEEFAKKLASRGISCANASTSDRAKRRAILMDFSAGRLKAISAVDVLNEGIDVPDVNMIVFLRATHSRRIFVQQLGRGLRLAQGKEKVIVLDFVTDIRRMAAVVSLDREFKGEIKRGSVERLWLNRDSVKFSNDKAQNFIEAWLDDVASLEDSDESQQLTFPDMA
jgi:superfamily II DNA or RNA helicase